MTSIAVDTVTPSPLDALLVLLRALKLPAFTRHAEEIAIKANREGWTFSQYLQHLAELEIEERRTRRIDRALRDSDLPTEKTLATLERGRLSPKVMKQMASLCEGGFVERGENLLVFGLPGRGKSHVVAAIGHELIRHGYRVLFTPTFALVQRLLAAKRDLRLERELAALDIYHAVILDSCAVPGYVELPAGFAGNQAFLRMTTPHNSGTTSGQSASNHSRTDVLERHVRGTSSSPIGPAFVTALRLVSRSTVA
jgi:hypothetical protein